MGPRLLSYIAVLAGEYHLSVRKIQRLLKDTYGVHFSVGAISEAQGKVSSMLTPTHQALHQRVKQADVVHADETSHHRNGENRTRWFWLAVTGQAVFQAIRSSRSQQDAQFLLGADTSSIVISDRCPSYNWLPAQRHQFCWAHIVRNLQQMADYAGKGLTAKIGQRLTLLSKAVFRVQHRFEEHEINEERWRRRMQSLRKRLNHWLAQGLAVPASRYAGRCKSILGQEAGLWVFLNHPGLSLTNNEAERRLRGTVILRKISFGTTSDRGDKFRARVLSIIETCKVQELSPLATLHGLISAAMAKQHAPEVFNLTV